MATEERYYPGSKTKIEPKKPHEPYMPPNKDWDSHPVFMMYKKQTIEVFYRGALAKALNREVVSIRRMEAQGVIRTPALHDRKKPHWRWLYTRDQIEDLIKLATDEGVMNPKLRKPFSHRFIAEAHDILSRLPL